MTTPRVPAPKPAAARSLTMYLFEDKETTDHTVVSTTPPILNDEGVLVAPDQDEAGKTVYAQGVCDAGIQAMFGLEFVPTDKEVYEVKLTLTALNLAVVRTVLDGKKNLLDPRTYAAVRAKWKTGA